MPTSVLLPPESNVIAQERRSLDPYVSIIILTWNQLALTKECLASIERHTPEAHEIILVDNGSTDGTLPWLKEQVGGRENYVLIANSENLGFSKGCNQGIEAARGTDILLLNNDTVVTPNWLDGLMECLHSAPDVGIVGPMTNSISGIQMVHDVSIRGYGSPGRVCDGVQEKVSRQTHPSATNRRFLHALP